MWTCRLHATRKWQPLEMLLPYHPEFIVRRPKQLLTIF